MSGFLLLVLGAWAALAPMIGPYFDVAYTPNPDDAWHWTAARGWLEVLPGGAVFLGGLLLIVSASRVMTMLGGWLAAVGGAWLIVGPPLADALTLDLGQPDPATGTNHQAFDAVVLFYGVGAVILFVAAVGLGRLSVISVRDVRAAEQRIAADEEAAAVPATTYPAAPPARDDAERADETGRHSMRDEDGAPTTAMQQPTTGQPTTGQPTTGQPTTGQPGYGQPPTYAQTAPPPSEQR